MSPPNLPDTEKALPPQPLAPLKRKIAAILAADVAGYSRLVAADEERTLRDLSAARAIFDAAILRNGGRIFNTAGDSVMCEFDSAVEAVRVAIDIQEALGAWNRPVPAERRLEFRIGMTIGDVVERDGDLLGDGVNLAARLEGLAPAGGICVSRSVHEAVANKLPVDFRDLGPRIVKNIPQPVHAFVVTARRTDTILTAEPAALTASSSRADEPVLRAERRARGSAQSRVGALASVAAILMLVFFGLPLLKAGRASLEAWLSPGPTNLASAPASSPVEIPAKNQAAPTRTPPVKTPARPVVEKAPSTLEPGAAFAALSRDGIVPDARTLAELYHNARVQELKPDRNAALKSYAAAAPLGGDFVDPVWRYAALLRARGADAARRTLADLARNAPSQAAQLVLAMASEPADQRGALEAFAAANPDYAPVDYLLADAYLARAGGPTLSDRRLAFDALDRFLEAGAQLPGFFVDRAVLDAWLGAARKRRAEIETFFVSAAQPRAEFSRGEAGWIARLSLPESATDVAVRIGEGGNPLAPLGSSGKPVTSAEVTLPASTPRTTLYVGYRDGSGRDVGPFPLPFDPGAATVAASRDALERYPESWIQFRTDLPDLISYAQLVTNRCAIGRALIGYGDEPPTQALPLPGCEAGIAAPAAGNARSVLELPAGTDSVQVQIAYADGTESPVRVFHRP